MRLSTYVVSRLLLSVYTFSTLHAGSKLYSPVYDIMCMCVCVYLVFVIFFTITGVSTIV